MLLLFFLDLLKLYFSEFFCLFLEYFLILIVVLSRWSLWKFKLVFFLFLFVSALPLMVNFSYSGLLHLLYINFAFFIFSIDFKWNVGFNQIRFFVFVICGVFFYQRFVDDSFLRLYNYFGNVDYTRNILFKSINRSSSVFASVDRFATLLILWMPLFHLRREDRILVDYFLSYVSIVVLFLNVVRIKLLFYLISFFWLGGFRYGKKIFYLLVVFMISMFVWSLNSDLLSFLIDREALFLRIEMEVGSYFNFDFNDSLVTFMVGHGPGTVAFGKPGEHALFSTFYEFGFVFGFLQLLLILFLVFLRTSSLSTDKKVILRLFFCYAISAGLTVVFDPFIILSVNRLVSNNEVLLDYRA